ncbi:hypothetical protein J3R82DRAFT_11176 [Butyriboletus roseoflavus]|nr:hypothetical protein J3R82DRAFT_11176 [Butyriboletus roseoflavus]
MRPMKLITRAGDVAQLTLLYKMTRELLRRMPAYRGEVAAFHPKFPPGSPAACRESENPVPIDAPDIVYSDADDEAIAKFHCDTGESSLSDLVISIGDPFSTRWW